MSIFLIVLLVAAMIATVVALVRGIVIFLKSNHEDIARGGPGPSASGMKQNKMMQARILFQAIAILLVILLLMLGHGASSGQ
jgi:Hypoxia induced protein conserved region